MHCLKFKNVWKIVHYQLVFLDFPDFLLMTHWCSTEKIKFYRGKNAMSNIHLHILDLSMVRIEAGIRGRLADSPDFLFIGSLAIHQKKLNFTERELQ